MQNNGKIEKSNQNDISIDEPKEDAENEFHDLCQKSYVLTISESSLPHEFNFTLLEPASHIFWSYSYANENLNQIEGRSNKQAFVQLLRNSLESGLLRNINRDKTLKVEPGF